LLPDKIQGLTPAVWDAFNIQDEDDAIVRERFLDVAGPDLVDDFFVITDASWKKSVGPFSIKACELTTLKAEHAERVAEPFFAGDVIIMSPAKGTVAVVHHDGLIALLRG